MSKPGDDVRMRVLLIEDNPGDADLVADALAQSPAADIHLKHFDRLSEGLRWLHTDSVDIVLLDLSLPDAHGLDTVSRTHAALPEVPIVVLTSLDDEALAVKALREGAREYLVKGQIDGRILMRAIRWAIERNQAEQAQRKSHAELEMRVRERTLELAMVNDALRKEIAERRRIEKALRANKERLRSIVTTAVDGIIVTDGQGTVELFNPAAERLFGYTPQKILGQNIVRLMPSPYREEFDGYLSHFSATGQTKPIGFCRELVGLRQDGVTFPMELAVSEMRIGDDLKFTAIVHDITKRKRIEEALRESEQRYREMVEALPVALYTTDTECRITLYNEAAATLWGSRPALGQKQWCGACRLYCTDGTSLSHEQCPMAEALREKRPLKGTEGIAERPDGTGIPFIAYPTALYNTSGALIGAVNVLVDITEHKRAEQALRDADRRKDEFLAMLAHELRNPLAPIRNAAEILRLAGATEPKLQWAGNVIDRQVSHLTRLVNDLLDVARFMQGKISLEKTPLELGNVAELALETSRPLIESRKHVLTVSLPAEPIRLEGDLTRLAQVVSNLLNNAAKYTEEGGNIWLSAEVSGAEVVLRVRDTGVGIPSQVLPYVFQLFMQADRTLDRSQGGLGIGLTLVHSIVELHGGTVEAVSAGPGLGSEFIVRMPVMADKPPAEMAPSLANARAAETLVYRVLVVDDNEDAATSLALLLELQGHQVRTAHDGPAALRAAAEFRPHAVFLDIGLPGMDGYEVAARLRQQTETKKVLLVAVSGYGHAEYHQRSIGAGFDHHLVKPVNIQSLNALFAALE